MEAVAAMGVQGANQDAEAEVTTKAYCGRNPTFIVALDGDLVSQPVLSI